MQSYDEAVLTITRAPVEVSDPLRCLVPSCASVMLLLATWTRDHYYREELGEERHDTLR
jgi:hypothetical protein